jgi:hypothetical protein
VTSIGSGGTKVSIQLPEEKRVDFARRLMVMSEAWQPVARYFSLVSPHEAHELVIREKSDGSLVLDVLWQEVDGQAPAHTVTFSIPNDLSIFAVANGAAHFCYHLRRGIRQGALAQDVALQVFKLEFGETIGGWVPKATEVQVADGGAIQVDVTERSAYGLKLLNRSKNALYVWAFLFEVQDLSVCECVMLSYATPTL